MIEDDVVDCGRSDAHEPHHYYAGIAGGLDHWVVQARQLCLGHLPEDCLCHCGQPVTYGYDGDPTHHRGMCADCDAARCDAYPMDCPKREASR